MIVRLVNETVGVELLVHPCITDCVLVPLHGANSVRGFAVADEEDRAKLEAHRWFLANTGYAATSGGRVLMHRYLVGLERGDGRETDHRDRNRLNNRRGNLRVVTKASNRQNVAGRPHTSKHRGVHWHPGAGKWRAMVYHDGRSRHVGYFTDEEAAGHAAEQARAELMPGALPQDPHVAHH